jgi:hypothetical protein
MLGVVSKVPTPDTGKALAVQRVTSHDSDGPPSRARRPIAVPQLRSVAVPWRCDSEGSLSARTSRLKWVCRVAGRRAMPSLSAEATIRQGFHKADVARRSPAGSLAQWRSETPTAATGRSRPIAVTGATKRNVRCSQVSGRCNSGHRSRRGIRKGPTPQSGGVADRASVFRPVARIPPGPCLW